MNQRLYNTVTIKDSAAYIESSLHFFVLSHIIFYLFLVFGIIISIAFCSAYTSILRVLVFPLCLIYLLLYYRSFLKGQKPRNEILYIDNRIIRYHSPYGIISFSINDIISIKDTSYFHDSVYQVYRKWENQFEMTIKKTTQSNIMTPDIANHINLHIENNYLVLTIPDLHIDHTQYLQLFAFIENILQ